MSTDKTHTAALVILLTLAMLIGAIPCYGDHKHPLAPSPTPSPAASPAASSEKFDLKGFYLGMSKKDLKAAAGKKMFCGKSDEVNCFADTFCWIEGLSVAGTQTGITTFLIKNDRVTSFAVPFSKENFVSIADAFTSKYGNAQKRETETVKNRLGASFEKVKLGWTIKNASVALSNMEGNVDEGRLSIFPVYLSEQTNECLAKEAKAAQNDL